MKAVIAIDSFKGSMTSMDAGNAAMEGIRKVCDAEVKVMPLADGGEGTTEALISGLGGSFRTIEVTGPLGTATKACYGILNNGTTAVIEAAEACGITLVDRRALNPMKATTYGVGEMILDAVNHGCTDFIVGIGGSATTDGGTGMLAALGVEFLDAEGGKIGPGIEELDRIETISADKMPEKVKQCRFEIACDVKNPLCGPVGAVYIFGPQKGVKEEQKEPLDLKMRHYAEKAAEAAGKDFSCYEGAGASGGLGFAFKTFFPGAELKSGIQIVLDTIGLEKEVQDADIVITGEGRLDGQTAMGKVPVGVAKLAKKYGKTVIALAGSVTEDAAACNEEGIDAFFPIVRGVTTLDEAMDHENALNNMRKTTEQLFRLLKSVK